MGLGSQPEVKDERSWHAYQQGHHDQNGGDPLDA